MSYEAIVKFKGFLLMPDYDCRDLKRHSMHAQEKCREAMFKRLCEEYGLRQLLTVITVDERSVYIPPCYEPLLDVTRARSLLEWKAHCDVWYSQRCSYTAYPVLVMVGEMHLACNFLAKLSRVCMHLIRNPDEYDVCFIGRTLCGDSEKPGQVFSELDRDYEEYEDDEEGIPHTVLVRATRPAKSCMHAYLVNPQSIDKLLRLFDLEFLSRRVDECTPGLTIERAMQGFVRCGEVSAVASRRRLVSKIVYA